MAETKKVIDGVPVRLRGVRRGATSVVKFVNKCCRCGLLHDVKIAHSGKCPDVSVTFNRKDQL